MKPLVLGIQGAPFGRMRSFENLQKVAPKDKQRHVILTCLSLLPTMTSLR